MKTYRVNVDMDLEADDEMAAARIAWVIVESLGSRGEIGDAVVREVEEL